MTTRTRIARAVAALALALASGRATATAAAAADGRETATVPLKLVPIGGGQLKVGIEVSLAHGAPRLYTFDTGSSGFYAAYNPLWWSSFEPLGRAPIVQSYGDQAVFESTAVRSTIGIASDVGKLEAEVDMAKIDDAYGGPLGPKGESTWLDEVADGHAPLFGNFFGDFGSGLREANGLFAVLPQLPGNLSSGFAVQLGCGGGVAPKVVIGLTAAIRSRVRSWAPMLPADGKAFPSSGRPTYAQALLATSFSLRRGADEYAFATDSILDTGAPTTAIHENGGTIRIPDAFFASPEARSEIRVGTRYRVTAADTDDADGFALSLVAGKSPGFNRIDVAKVDGAGDVNLGLIPYLRQDVVFDVENGRVGFAPCSPRGGGYDPLRRSGLPALKRDH